MNEFNQRNERVNIWCSHVYHVISPSCLSLSPSKRRDHFSPTKIAVFAPTLRPPFRHPVSRPSPGTRLCDAAMHTSVSRDEVDASADPTCLETLRCALIRHRVNEAGASSPCAERKGCRGEESGGRWWRQSIREGSATRRLSDLASLVKESRGQKKSAASLPRTCRHVKNCWLGKGEQFVASRRIDLWITWEISTLVLRGNCFVH